MRSYFLNRLNSLKIGRFGRRSWTLSRLQAYQLGTNLEVIFCENRFQFQPILDLELKNSPSSITFPVGTILNFTAQKHVQYVSWYYFFGLKSFIYGFYSDHKFLQWKFETDRSPIIGLDNKSNKGESKHAIHVPWIKLHFKSIYLTKYFRGIEERTSRWATVTWPRKEWSWEKRSRS